MYSNCRKCGRRLTDPDSMARGYGPECWESITGEKVQHKRKKKIPDPEDDLQLEGQMSFADFPGMLPGSEVENG